MAKLAITKGSVLELERLLNQLVGEEVELVVGLLVGEGAPTQAVLAIAARGRGRGRGVSTTAIGRGRATIGT